jgi:hypothetical protein
MKQAYTAHLWLDLAHWHLWPVTLRERAIALRGGRGGKTDGGETTCQDVALLCCHIVAGQGAGPHVVLAAESDELTSGSLPQPGVRDMPEAAETYSAFASALYSTKDLADVLDLDEGLAAQWAQIIEERCDAALCYIATQRTPLAQARTRRVELS